MSERHSPQRRIPSEQERAHLADLEFKEGETVMPWVLADEANETYKKFVVDKHAEAEQAGLASPNLYTAFEEAHNDYLKEKSDEHSTAAKETHEYMDKLYGQKERISSRVASRVANVFDSIGSRLNKFANYLDKRDSLTERALTRTKAISIAVGAVAFDSLSPVATSIKSSIETRSRKFDERTPDAVVIDLDQYRADAEARKSARAEAREQKQFNKEQNRSIRADRWEGRIDRGAESLKSILLRRRSVGRSAIKSYSAKLGPDISPTLPKVETVITPTRKQARAKRATGQRQRSAA